jgi:S-formylglutathione hydrolase FrmB
VATSVVSARMRDVTVASPALGAAAKVRLLLPAHYATQPGRRWPVLYLLHGCCDTYESWTRSTDVEQLTARSDVLVVMPDGGKAGFYSDWLIGPRWETFHLVELRRIPSGTTGPARLWRSPARRWAGWARWTMPRGIAACSAPRRPSAESSIRV